MEGSALEKRETRIKFLKKVFLKKKKRKSKSKILKVEMNVLLVFMYYNVSTCRISFLTKQDDKAEGGGVNNLTKTTPHQKYHFKVLFRKKTM